jgi:hypothetical protein
MLCSYCFRLVTGFLFFDCFFLRCLFILHLETKMRATPTLIEITYGNNRACMDISVIDLDERLYLAINVPA